MYYVYILQSEKSGKYYTGYCSDIDTRILKHNSGATPSTKPGIPWKLVHSEIFLEKSSAIKREREIKNKKSRKYIEFLINRSTGYVCSRYKKLPSGNFLLQRHHRKRCQPMFATVVSFKNKG